MDPSSKKRGRFTLYDQDEAKRSPQDSDGHQHQSSKEETAPEDSKQPSRAPDMEAPSRANALPRTEMVPVEVYMTLQNVIGDQLSAMMAMHREIMLEVLRRDSRKADQVADLCRENAELLQSVGSLERENEVYWERLSRYKD